MAQMCIDAGAVKHRKLHVMTKVTGRWHVCCQLCVVCLQLTAFKIHAASSEPHGLVLPFPLPLSQTFAGGAMGKVKRQCGSCDCTCNMTVVT